MFTGLDDSLQPHNGDMVTRVCDYTGTTLPRTPGPRAMSLEAIYPFAIKDDRIAYHDNPTAMYRTLIQIGSKYGLTQYEFEYYLTIPSPRPLDRVSYPFHVLSRPRALQNGWDWNKVTALTRFMVRNLSTYCNKDAFKQGLQEVLLDPTNMIYWLADYFSHRIAQIKKERPTASMEEVLFYNLDRWSLPIVP
ncbi:hypothetical protein THARTR1_06437 [Trichoderma harzianum]|uniref:Uncharacterized protein n=1 Tax=Trichoderma harzianum TaxID=5544 RepID=A0A2K0U556_TRIHA|nr:hypothetical protein THARTR1_06437 [Trichoderma harzianum]